MKDLDEKTLHLVRHLAENQKRLESRYRGLRMVVIWVGGKKEVLADWARKNKITDLTLAVIVAEDETLNPWRINPLVDSTTILVNRTKPLSVMIDLKENDLKGFEKQLDENFQKYRRCIKD